MKKLFTAASLIALLAIPAVAQNALPPSTPNTPSVASPATTAPAAKTVRAAYSGQISARQLLDQSVTNAADESIGDINDILIGSDGKIAAVIVGVGGFLGMGEKDVALPFDQLTFAKDEDNDLVVGTGATKESLQSAPEYITPEDRP